MRNELDAAEAAYEEARELFAEIGHATLLSWSLSKLADAAFEKGDLKRSEKLMRESIRLLAPLGQHRELAEARAELARILADPGQGRRRRVLPCGGTGVTDHGGAAAASGHRARAGRRPHRSGA